MTPPRVLLVATTTGYQTRAFGEAAARLGADLVFATDRCAVLDDPWRDAAIPVRFHDVAGSLVRVRRAAAERPIDAVLAVGDRPAVFAAHVREMLDLKGHSSAAAGVARSKQRTREHLRDAGLPVPHFAVAPLHTDPARLAAGVPFPAVLKPVSLSGSRGVMRVERPDLLPAALERLRTLLSRPDIRAEREAAHEFVLLESFIPGHEYALEGLMTDGRLTTLAVFDKPDPLDGPFFEESIYVTLGDEQSELSKRIADTVAQAASAIGLRHGPVHAECRVNAHGVFVLEVAARPIGGICARALRFTPEQGAASISLEELLLRHACGENVEGWSRGRDASGVMMIPIPRRGFYRQVDGIDAARRVEGIEDVVITAKPDQLMLPLPEGASYLGFIFAAAAVPTAVDRALREAHARLSFSIDPELPMLQSTHG